MDGLLMLVVVVLCLVVSAVALSVAWLLLLTRRIRARNRVSPRIPSAAPIDWLASPARAARLHRRLRAAVILARSCCDRLERARLQLLSLLELVDELERVATSVDDRLVEAGRATTDMRRRLLNDLEVEVRQIEAMAVRITKTVDGWSAVAPERPAAALARISDRLQGLDEAMKELEAADAALGSAVRLPPPPDARAVSHRHRTQHPARRQGLG